MNNNETKNSEEKIKSVKVNWRLTHKPTETLTGVINGDGLCLKMEKNNRQLEIVGDGCRVTIVNNYKSVKIIGDGSRLEIINKNFGEIEYHGDGGRIILPDTTDPTSNAVRYIGDGGKIITKKIQSSSKKPR